MRLVLISDTHLAPSAAAFDRNLAAAAAAIAELSPALVIHLGDVTADGVGDRTQFAYARARLSTLSAPMLAIPGNHDIGDCPPGGREPALDLESLAAFRAAFGPDRWSLRVDGWLMVGLNAQLFGSHTAEEAQQDAWLDGVLREGGEPVALFLHKPLFLQAYDDHPSHARYVPLEARRRLLGQVSHRDLRLVASGHVHQRKLSRHGGAAHLWTPSTAFFIPDKIQETIGSKACGFAVVELGRGEPQVSFEQPTGLVDHDLLDHPEVYPQVAAMRAHG